MNNPGSTKKKAVMVAWKDSWKDEAQVHLILNTRPTVWPALAQLSGRQPLVGATS